MKIAFIGQKGIPAKLGGVERHVEELATRLAQDGHEVFAYVRNNYTDKGMNEYKGVKLIHLPSIATKNLDAISHTFFAIVHAIFHRYDVVHVHSIGPNSLNFLLRIFKPGTALVATHHCQDYAHQKWGFFARTYLKFGEYMACRIPHKTIVISNTLQKIVKERFGTDAVVIPNGANVSISEDSSELEKWGLEKGGYILAVSRLIRHKGLQYLIPAFKELEDRGLAHGKKLVIVGDGFYTDDYVSELKDLAEGRKSIIFTGAQSGQVLSQLFSNCLFFVQPSDSEGLSIALLEAMGYGKAVLVSDIPENKEAVSDAGLLFNHGDVYDLGIGMANLLENKDGLIESLGEKGKARVDEQYDWSKIVKKTEELYEGIIPSC